MTTVPPNHRAGVLAAGNFIVDAVKLIDRWPTQDALVRIRRESFSNGGGPYNLLKNLAKLGVTYPLAAIGRLGNDAHAATIRRDCAAHGICTRQLLATDGAATSYTDVMTVMGDGRRTFFHHTGANAHLRPDDIDFPGTPARFFYLGYLLLLDGLDAPGPDARPGAASVLARARAAGLCTALDCVSEDSDRFAAVVSPVLPEVDILFANDFEAEKLTGHRLGRGNDLDRAAFAAAGRDLLRQGVRELVVIHAPEGVLAVTSSGETHWQPSVLLPSSVIAGTAGAGDALAAAFLHSRHEGWSVPAGLRLGVCAAAASLRNATCSDGVLTTDACLALGNEFGFRTEPFSAA